MKLSFVNDPAFWQSDAFFRYIAEFASQGILATDASYRYVFVNGAMAAVFGRSVEEMLGLPALAVGVAGTGPQIRDLIMRRRAGIAEKAEFPICRPDGEVRWVLFDVIPMIDDSGEFRGVLASGSDITERKRREDQLREREKQLSSAEQIARFGSWSWEVNSDCVQWSDELYRIYGLRPQSQEISLERYLSLVHPDDRNRVKRQVESALANRAPFQFSERIVHSDGSTRHLVSRGRVICDATGTPRQVMGICMDVTERREDEARMQHLMYHDALTNLPNRQVLKKRLDECLARAARYKRVCALLIIDLDHFTTVNESLGPELGDVLLEGLAKRLSAMLSRTDFIASLGGDKFAVLLEEVPAASDAAFTAIRILDEVTKPLQLGEQSLQISASIGIASYPDNGSTSDTLLKHAGSAVRACKQSGRGHYEFYASEMSEEANQLLGITHGLESALGNDEFFLVYEPRIDATSGALLAVQVLLRWQPPGERVRKPEQFMKAAEQTGRIGEIDRWMLRTACQDLARWKKDHKSPLKLSISLSGGQTLAENFVTFVRETLSLNQLHGSDIELEISESLMITDFETVRTSVTELAADGVSLASADFGTGEARCPQLLDLPISAMKISRRFVEALGINAKGAIAVEAVSLIARRLGGTVFADGVENVGQVVKLQELGCHQVQGRWVSPPLPAFAMKEYLEESAVKRQAESGRHSSAG